MVACRNCFSSGLGTVSRELCPTATSSTLLPKVLMLSSNVWSLFAMLEMVFRALCESSDASSLTVLLSDVEHEMEY